MPRERVETVLEDVDPTERFERTEGDVGFMVLGAPGGDPTELDRTQPMPRARLEDFDEDLISTREMPVRNEGTVAARERMASKPGKETGLFPHPAAGPRTTGLARPRHVPAANKQAQDDVDHRLHTAYEKYLLLCKKHAQATVGEGTFTDRLRARLDRLAEVHDRGSIEFRPVLVDGAVRVRVLLSTKRK
jgi:hypothetical protein